MLKYKVTQDEFELLDDSIKSLYVQNGELYSLAVDGAVDAEEAERIKAAKAQILDEKKRRDQELREIEAERKRAADEAARKAGDWESVEKSYQEKTQALEAQLQEYKTREVQSKIGSEASKIAAKLSSNPNNQELLTDFIKRRLSVTDDGLRVLDADGKPTISTAADLEREFRASGRFDALIDATKASGTGGSGGAKAPQPSEMSEEERVALFRNNPQEYNRQFGK